MKKMLYLFLPVMFFIANHSYGQVFTEVEKSMSKGVNNALVIDLGDMSAKTVAKEWKKFMKDFDAKTKRNRKFDEYFTDNADIPTIGSGYTIDVYARAEEASGKVNLIVWFDLGEEFLSSKDPHGRFEKAKDFLYKFYHRLHSIKLKDDLEAEEKKAKKLDAELKKLISKNERYHKKIENAKEVIRINEKNIEENEIAQEEQKKLIEEEAKVLAEKKKILDDWERKSTREVTEEKK